jgi:ATP-dependent DNA helicase RecG
VIRDMPPGRTAVETMVVPDDQRAAIYREAAEEVRRGRQVYIVYPLVDDSDKVQVRAAIAMADHLAADVFPAFRVGLVHGRMAADLRDGVMHRFGAGELDVLVATTVIEVGIDVANASMMVVEHAERFGLAQLHQLRGRVGRGRHRSRCVLIHQQPLTNEARARLETLVATTDGFVIAERDLALRGPGDLSGLRQAGMPTLRVGDLVRDRELMELAQREARAWLETARGQDDVVAAASRAWTERFGLVEVG